MKHMILVLCMAGLIHGCGTIKGTTSGFLDGASEDLKTLSDKVR